MGTLFEVDSSGQLQQKLALGAGAEVTKSYLIPAAAMADGSQPSGVIIINDVNTFRTFDPNVNESAIYNVVMPTDYKNGTNITFDLIWCPSTTATGDVRWRIQVNRTEQGTSFNVGGITTVGGTGAAAGTIYERVVGPALVYNGTGVTSDSAIGVEFERAATGGADTYTGDAYLWGVLVTYTSDSLGD